MEIFNTTWKVLIPIFKYPTEGLSIRKIAKLTRITHPTVIKIVKKLEKEGIAVVERRKNICLVRGNFENEKFVELKKIYNMLSLKPLVTYLVEKYSPEVIVCFGSYSRGTDFEGSDIDLYTGFEKLEIEDKELTKFERKLNRKVQIFSGDLKSFPSELLENIMNGIKLYGWFRL
jgi:predicted nucleotidyltransferase